MKKYLIENNGCDDTTRFEIELGELELATIIRFIKANNKASKYQCQPEIDIYDTYFYDDEGNPITSKRTVETAKPMNLED